MESTLRLLDSIRGATHAECFLRRFLQATTPSLGERAHAPC